MLQKAHVLLFHIVANRTAAAAEVANHLVRKQEKPKQNSSNQASREEEEEEEEHQQQHSKKLRHSSTTMETQKIKIKNRRKTTNLTQVSEPPQHQESELPHLDAETRNSPSHHSPLPPPPPSLRFSLPPPFLSFLILVRSSSPPLHGSSHPPQSRVLFPVSLSHCCCQC
jgi:hypothetical protein